MTSRARWGLAAILLLGVSLRCIALESRGIQYDDAFSILLAKQNLAAIIQGTAADTMPPLYYFLLHFWIAIGGLDLAWLRLLSVLFSLGCMAVLFLIVRKLAGENAGLAAVFLAALSPLQIYHAQDLRMYALLALAQLAYALFFIRIWRNDEQNQPWGDWLGLVISGAAAMYTHNLAIFMLVVPDFILLVQRSWRSLGQLITAQLGIALLALPWLVMVPGQVEKIQRAFWTPRPGWTEVIQAMILLTTNLPLAGAWLAVGLALSLVVFILVAWQAVRLWRKGYLPSILLALAFLPPVLLFAASYIMRPVFVTRGFLAAALVFLGVAGVILAREWRKPAAMLLLASFLAGAAIGLPAHYEYDRFPRSPFQPAMESLRGMLQPGDRILHDNKLSFFPSVVYAPDLPQFFLPDAPGSENDTLAPGSQEAMGIFPAQGIADAVGNANCVYFVVFSETIEEYRQQGLTDHPQLAWLKERFKENNRATFNDLIVYRFDR